MLRIIQIWCVGTPLLSYGLDLKKDLLNWMWVAALLGTQGGLDLGGLLKNSEERWLMGFTGYGGFCSNILLELLRIKYGLLVSWDRGFRKVICNSDYTDVIRLIHDDFNKYHLFEIVIFLHQRTPDMKLESSFASYFAQN